ncbi:MAG: 50S ribosomal protein L9 [Sphingobacteriaceae bacterium]|nr:50S ribosomal protein L9 [Sphingobacteriaceae bacterium]
MEVILKQDIKGLGYKNDMVTVRNGYGRNFLLPKGMAVLATDSAKKMHAEILKQSAFKEEKLRAEAVVNAEKLANVTVKVGAKAGENGKIFGSVTTIQVADALLKAGFNVERKNIEINGESVKQLGTYSAKVRLFKEITANVNFEVVAE